MASHNMSKHQRQNKVGANLFFFLIARAGVGGGWARRRPTVGLKHLKKGWDGEWISRNAGCGTK